MPQKLHNPPTHRVTLLRLNNPRPEPLIIAQRPLKHLFPTNSKLRTTSRPNLPRPLPLHFRHNLPLRTRPPKNIRPNLRRNMRIIPMRLQTPRIPITAQIYISIFLYESDLEGAESSDVVVKGGIGVPG